MRSASLRLQPATSKDTAYRPQTGPAPAGYAAALTLAAMSLGYGVVQLDVTIVNTALHRIGTSLGGGVSELQWVVSAYTITFAAFILMAGVLGDRIGAKRIFALTAGWWRVDHAGRVSDTGSWRETEENTRLPRSLNLYSPST